MKTQENKETQQITVEFSDEELLGIAASLRNLQQSANLSKEFQQLLSELEQAEKSASLHEPEPYREEWAGFGEVRFRRIDVPA